MPASFFREKIVFFEFGFYYFPAFEVVGGSLQVLQFFRGVVIGIKVYFNISLVVRVLVQDMYPAVSFKFQREPSFGIAYDGGTSHIRKHHRMRMAVDGIDFLSCLFRGDLSEFNFLILSKKSAGGTAE